MVTLTPSSDVGRWPSTISSLVQVRPGNVLARLAPLIVTHDPASMPGSLLAPLNTEVMAGGPGFSIFATNTSPKPVGGCSGMDKGKLLDHVWPARTTFPWESSAAASAPSSREPPR